MCWLRRAPATQSGRYMPDKNAACVHGAVCIVMGHGPVLRAATEHLFMLHPKYHASDSELSQHSGEHLRVEGCRLLTSACILQVPLRVQTACEPLPADGGCRAQGRRDKKLSEAEGRTIHTTRHPGHIGMRQWRRDTPKLRRGRAEAGSA